MKKFLAFHCSFNIFIEKAKLFLECVNTMIPFKTNRCAWKWNTSRLHGILILFFKKNSEHLGLSLKCPVNLNPRNNFYVFEHRSCNQLMLVRWSQEILEPTPRMCFCFYSRKTSHSMTDCWTCIRSWKYNNVTLHQTMESFKEHALTVQKEYSTLPFKLWTWFYSHRSFKNTDPTSIFKCKSFEVLVDKLINFFECQIFNNVYHLEDIVRKYEVKPDYHLKIIIN
jgi:hypothetical protein